MYMSSQTKELAHLKTFIDLIEKSKVSVEFEDPEELEILLTEYKNKIVEYAVNDAFKKEVRLLMYELDAQTRKLITVSVGVNCRKIGYTKYAPYVENNLDCLRRIIGEYNILDVAGAVLLTFSENNILNFDKFEGISYLTPYFVPTDDEKDNKPSHITDEFLAQMYGNMGLFPKQNEIVEKLFEDTMPFYTSFAKDYSTPAKYGLDVIIKDKAMDVFYDYYNEYVNMENVINFIKNYSYLYDNSTISFQFSPHFEDYFAFEFRLPRESVPEVVSMMRQFKCFDEQILQNIIEIRIPEFMENCIVKFRWKDKDNQTCKFYMETENRDHIRSVV